MKPAVEHDLIRAGVRPAPQHLTGLDLRVGHPGSPCLLVYPQGLDAAAIAQSLTRLLAAYPVLTGRMKADANGHIYIDDSDAGVAFTVHRHTTPMPAYNIDHTASADVGRYFQQIYPWKVVGHPQPLLAFAVHQFACGGTILSVMGVHSVWDGGAFWTFMQDWIRTHHGHPITPPSLERQGLIDVCEANMTRPYTQGYVKQFSTLQRTGLMARMAWQHFTQMETKSFRVSPTQIAAWRDEARQQGEDADMPAAHEFVVAHCLKHLSARLPNHLTRHIGQISDLRFRRIPGIARKYVGNAVGHDLLSLPAEAFADTSLARIARRCRMAMDRNSEDDILSYLGLMGRHRLTHSNQSVWVKGIAHCVEGGTMVNNCAHFPVYKMDFGQGPPSWFDFGRTPYRMLVLLPSAQKDKGFDVHFTARRQDLAGFGALMQ